MPHSRPDDEWDPEAEAAEDADVAADDPDADPEGPQEIDLVAGDDEAETVACPHCGTDVYEDADRCPHCGEWIAAGGGGSTWPLWVAGVALVLILYLAYQSYGAGGG